jgi:hypothetical protein
MIRRMNTNDARADARSRAGRRLRRMTIGTALLGIAATGGLGWTAALSYDGAGPSTDATATVSSTDMSTAALTGSTAGAVSATPTTTTTAMTSAATAAPVVTWVTGNAHVSSGGS